MIGRYVDAGGANTDACHGAQLQACMLCIVQCAVQCGVMCVVPCVCEPHNPAAGWRRHCTHASPGCCWGHTHAYVFMAARPHRGTHTHGSCQQCSAHLSIAVDVLCALAEPFDPLPPMQAPFVESKCSEHASWAGLFFDLGVEGSGCNASEVLPPVTPAWRQIQSASCCDSSAAVQQGCSWRVELLC